MEIPISYVIIIYGCLITDYNNTHFITDIRNWIDRRNAVLVNRVDEWEFYKTGIERDIFKKTMFAFDFHGRLVVIKHFLYSAPVTV